MQIGAELWFLNSSNIRQLKPLYKKMSELSKIELFTAIQEVIPTLKTLLSM